MGAGPVLCLGHAVRRVVLGGGPLKRSTDRVHVLLRVLLALAVVSSPQVGLTAAAASRAALTATADAVRASLVEVEAELTGPPSTSPDPSPEETGWAPAVWRSPDGEQVEGQVLAAGDARSGDRVVVWVGADGRRRPAPLEAEDVTVQSGAIGVVAALMSVVGAGLAYLAGVALLDRARARRWAAGWAAVEPRWRQQLL